jgi:short-subunit dehydrogenase
MSNDRIAVVTGGTSGIGLELARLLAREGHSLVLVAEREEKLEAAAHELVTAYGVTVRTIPKNLAQADAAEVLDRQLASLGVEDLDVLVNDAGVGVWGRFLEVPLSEHLRVLSVNLVSLTTISHRLAPALVRRGGRMLNLASTASYQPGPNMAVYYATKAYVLSLSLSLAEELEPLGVRVTALCPGPTETEFAARAGMAETRAFQDREPMAADEVARIGFEAMKSGERLVIAGLRNKLMVEAERVLPERVVTRISKGQLEKTD